MNSSPNTTRNTTKSNFCFANFLHSRLARCLFASALLAVTTFAHADDRDLASRLKSAVTRELSKSGSGARLGLSVVDLESGREIFGNSSDETLVPASVLKLVTTVTALRVLGGEYRFTTQFLLARTTTGAVDLYVKGKGDPSLLGSKLSEISEALLAQGVNRIRHLIIDDSSFIQPRGALGSNPYQAALSAVSLNHNSYELTLTPTSNGNRALAQVTLGSGIEVINQLKTVKGAELNYRVGQSPESNQFKSESEISTKPQPFSSPTIVLTVTGTIGESAAPAIAYQSVGAPAQYFGKVFRRVLEVAGVEISGELLRGITPNNAKLVHTARSKGLAEILRDLNHYSNNFIASQIVFILGEEEGSYSQTAGLRKMEQLLTDNGIAGAELFDGSGLDRRNKLSARSLTQLLSLAYRDLELAPDLLSSLSRFGNTGTLKSRSLSGGADRRDRGLKLASDFSSRADGVWGKTGSLAGVSSLAGYAEGVERRRYAFALIGNDFVKKEFEDKIVSLILGAE